MCALLTPMNVDSSQIELRLPNDKRLIVAVEAVVAHAGERAGLSQQEQKELAREAVEACDETFSLAARNSRANPILRVTVSDFPNRVEVSIEESKDAQTGSADAFRNLSRPEMPDPVTAALEQMSVDRVHHEFREGRPRTVLVKHHAAGGRTYHKC